MKTTHAGTNFPATIADAAFEFGDDPHAIIHLVLIWQHPRETFYAEYTEMRQQRDRRRALAQPFQENGYAIVPPRHHLNRPPYPMSALRDAQGTAPTWADVRQHPYLWSIDISDSHAYADNATGVEIDEEQIDWDIEGDHDPKPKPGMASPHQVHEINVYYGALFCLNPAAAGLHLDPSVNMRDHWERPVRIETLRTELIDTRTSESGNRTAASYRRINVDGSYSDHTDLPLWTDTTTAIVFPRAATDTAAVKHAIDHAPLSPLSGG